MGRNLTNLHISESFQYLTQISGSELTDGLGVDIDSLNISASYATTASFALNAGASTLQEVLDNSNEANADIILTGSYQRVSGSFSGTAIDNITDTYTGTEKIQHVITLTQAEYDALTPEDNTFYVITDADATMVTGSVADATLTFTKDDATTFDLTVDNVANAVSASHAITADSLEGGISLQSVLDTGNTATEDINLTGDLDVTGGVDIVGDLDLGGTGNSISGTLGSAIVIGSNQTISAGGDNGIYSGINNTINSDLYNAIIAGNGNTVSHARSVVIGGTGLSTTKEDEVVVPSLVANSITASFASFQSASIGYLEAITGSAKIIGDAYIILNNNTPTERYAGLVVQDSGSTQNTASLEFDGQTNDWFYEYTDDGGATVDHGVAMFGPEYNTKGSPVYPSNNTILKGNGGHHVEDSSIVDDGSTITLGNKLDGLTVSGSVEITGSTDIIGIFNAGDGSGTGATGANSATIAGGDHNVSGERGIAAGGFQNTVSGTDAAVVGGFGQTASGLRSIVVGGIAGNATNIYSAILGGSSNSAEGVRGTIVGGDQGFIDSSTNDGIIIGSYQSNIENQAHNSTIINGFQSNIDGYSGSAIIGGTGIDADAHHTVYVPNLHLTGSTGGTLTFSDGTTMTTAGGGGAAFPYTGSAQITGSLGVTGSIESTEDVVFNGITVGLGAGQGARNTAVGEGALDATTSAANDNVAIGYQALSGALTGDYNVAVGKHAGRVLAAASVDNIYIGWAAGFSQTGGNDNVMIGAVTGQSVTNADNNTLVGSQVATALTTGDNNTIVGPNGSGGGLTTGGSNTILGKATGLTSTLANNIILADGAGNIAYQYDNASTSTEINGKITVGDANNVNSGTDSMLLSIDSNTTGTRNGILGGYQNTASDTDSVVLGGYGNTASGLRGGILAGQSNTASHIRSVVLGGISLSTSKADEAVVNHLTTNGTVVQDVKTISITSNTGSLDASTGNMFEITLQNATGTHLEIENQTAGQTFQLKITNNATAAGTITFDSQFEFEGGTAFTATAATNAVDILTLTTFDGTSVQCVGAKNFS